MKSLRMFEAVKRSDRPYMDCLYAALVPILVYLTIQIGAFIGTFAIMIFTSLTPSELIQFLFFTMDPIFLNLAIFVFYTLLLFVWVKGVERRPLIDLGFYKKGALLQLVIGWGIGFAMITAIVAVMLLTGALHLDATLFSLPNLINLLAIAPFWFLQSGTEELLTRGWLFPVVSKKTNLVIGTAVSSLLFSFLHIHNHAVTWVSLLNISLFGLLACLYVLYTDNIWGVSAIHATWNCIQGHFYGLPVSGISPAYSLMRFSTSNQPDYLTGGMFGPEGSIYSSLVMGIVILLLGFGLWKRKGVA